MIMDVLHDEESGQRAASMGVCTTPTMNKDPRHCPSMYVILQIMQKWRRGDMIAWCHDNLVPQKPAMTT